jgi:hypothetical protein
MTGSDSRPSHSEVRRILAAAADVIFSDGVPAEFLDQWADETVFLLSVEPGRPSVSQRRRSS